MSRLISIPRVAWKYGGEQTADRYIFHHIPKCAGTSAVDLLRQWYHVQTDYPSGWADEDNRVAYQKFCERPFDIEQFQNSKLLAGHFHIDGSFLDQRYPNWFQRGFKAFTFLRDPLDLRISLYKYEIKNKRYSSSEPIEKRILTNPNYIAGRLPCTTENYKEILDRYFFIGLVDNYQESFDTLAGLMNRPRLKLGNLNVSEKSDVKLSNAVISEFKELNELDYKVYDYGRGKYMQQIQQKKSQKKSA